jgi:hypothetical protein
MKTGSEVGRFGICRKQTDRGSTHLDYSIDASRSTQLVSIEFIILRAGAPKALVQEADKTISISDEALFREFQAQVYALVGLKEKARQILNGLLSKKFKGYASPMQIGLTYYILGEKDSGYQWTQKAYEARDASLPIMNKWPTEKVAREDPRFIELLNRMKLP